MNPANRNTLWASVFVGALCQGGLRAVCLAPGSRSTPLAMAFAASGVPLYVHNDERSAAYFALGLAQAARAPVAVVGTSGTAIANFFPAVVEANYSEVPLIVLSADRPAELRESGANQTIDQLKLFGDQVRAFVEMPPPEANASRHVLRAVQTAAARALATALAPLPGPVHLNFPFRKPLEPVTVPADRPAWLDEAAQAAWPPVRVTFGRPELHPAPADLAQLTALAEAHPRGLLVCGPRCPGGAFPAQVTALAGRLGWPVLADALSGVRFGPQVHSGVLGGYDLFLPGHREALRPQVIVRFGDVPTSATLGDWLDALADVPQVRISETPRWRDDRFTVTHSLWADPARVCAALHVQRGVDAGWLAAWQAAEAQAWAQVGAVRADPDFEAGIVLDVLADLPEGGALWVASSLPVRHLDQFAIPDRKTVRVFANRGASGIDGTLSSALGAAVQHPGLVFVTGDLTFYHDMNGLLALKRHGLNAHIVLINNDGGGIFQRLPIARHEPPFTGLFLTPHGLTFAPAADLYGLAYRTGARDVVRPALQTAWRSGQPHLIEVISDSARFEALRQRAF